MNEVIRVLHVVTYMGRGGLETMLMNYYRYMDKNKIQFDFLVHRDFEADYDQEILSLGGKIYHLPQLNPFSLNYRKQLNQFFQQHPEYKIVHVHQDCLSSIILKYAKKNNVLVRIAHSHNANQDKNIKYLIKLYYRNFIPKYATNLFACSMEAGDWMFNDSHYCVLSNAIDIKSFNYSLEKRKKIRNDLNISDDIIIGHVGRFHPQKNHKFLIKIFLSAISLNDKVKLLLVGGGEGINDIKKQIKALNIEDKVIFTGVRDDVNDLMQAMDVFVLPSLYEGLGIVAIEAQAAGLPCVLSEGVPKETKVTNGLVTWKSLDDSPESWAKHILNQVSVERCNHEDEIIKAGYDIVSSSKKLEDFYIKKYKGV